ncbi:MAG: NAD-dependent epimerase/dehydratase family protein, partial [Nitrososphaeraceae archaeon]
GYTGFIGSHLVDLLLKEYNVIGLSRKTKNRQIYQIRKDVRKVTINEIPKNVDYIVHLAAVSDVQYCQNYPTQCFEINVKGTQNMLEIARKIGSKFLFLSTSHVYGLPQSLPIKENHPANPTSIYSASKLAAEIISESYARSYGMDVSIIRLFSVYGPMATPHLVTSEIISQLLTKNKISIGNLHPKRDFIYVKDAVNAIKTVLKKSKGFGIYNVGYGKSHSISDLCNILLEISGSDIPINSVKSQSRKQDINEVRADISKIMKLGWKPNTGLRKGLKMTLDWWRSNMKS